MGSGLMWCLRKGVLEPHSSEILLAGALKRLWSLHYEVYSDS